MRLAYSVFPKYCHLYACSRIMHYSIDGNIVDREYFVLKLFCLGNFTVFIIFMADNSRLTHLYEQMNN